MNELKSRLILILHFFEYDKEYSISDISKEVTPDTLSSSTLKRDLSDLEKKGFIRKTGERRALTYSLTNYGLLHRPFDLVSYQEKPEYEKKGLKSYNFALFDMLEKEDLFTSSEHELLAQATKRYKEKSKLSVPALQKKELERFIIELSWKSSKIEGNTYTLLDTEKLLREGVFSSSHTKDEATMIVNHKKAFMDVLLYLEKKESVLSFKRLEEIHKALVTDLGIHHGIRKGSVGITGSLYLPLALPQAIESETRRLIETLKKKEDVFPRTLIAILSIGYLQPFEDGNKRTSRLFGNALLLEGGKAPLSYRSVDEKKYREAMLVFYEQNSIEPFKKIFIEQYLFSCENYTLETQ